MHVSLSLHPSSKRGWFDLERTVLKKPSKNGENVHQGKAEQDKAMILWELRGSNINKHVEAEWD